MPPLARPGEDGPKIRAVAGRARENLPPLKGISLTNILLRIRGLIFMKYVFRMKRKIRKGHREFWQCAEWTPHLCARAQGRCGSIRHCQQMLFCHSMQKRSIAWRLSRYYDPKLSVSVWHHVEEKLCLLRSFIPLWHNPIGHSYFVVLHRRSFL